MKKICALLLISTLCLGGFPKAVFAEGYTSKGVFTTGIDVGTGDVSCEDVSTQMEEVNKAIEEDIRSTPLPKENEDDRDNKFLQIMLGPIYRIIADTFGAGDKEGVIASCSEEFSFTKHIMKLTSPVKLTDFTILMTFMTYIQGIAFCFVILFIVQYGFQYVLGRKEIENPMKFAHRLMLAIFGTMYAPYLIQDLLNLNNIVVYYISSIPIPTATAGKIAAGGAALGVAGSMAIANFLMILAANVASGVGIFVLIFILILFILILVPLIKLMVWWYLRLFTLLLYTAFSPIFFLMYASEATAKFSKRFFMTLLAEIFSQIFVTIGFYFAIMLVMNFDTVATTFDIGFIGLMLFLWVIVQLLSELPSWVKGWIGGSDAPGARAITQMAAMGIGQAIGSSFDRSLKKHNEKSARKTFQQNNEKQAGAIQEVFGNNNAWQTMNDPEAKLEEAKAAVMQAGQGKAKPSGGQLLDQLKLEKQQQQPSSEGTSRSYRTQPAPSGGHMNTTEPFNTDTLQQAKNDDYVFNMQAPVLDGYGEETKQRILQGAKEGTLSREEAETLLTDDLLAQGYNLFAAGAQAVRDVSQMKQEHGIEFGQANQQVVFDGGVQDGNRRQVFSSRAMGMVQSGLENGTMHRSQAVALLANDLQANRMMGQKQAMSIAEERMKLFEANNPLGLGFEAQSQINRLAKNGDLNQKNLRDIVKKDAMFHKGMKNKEQIERHTDAVLSKGGFNDFVGVKSHRETASVKKTPGLNLGHGIRTSGGVRDGANPTVGSSLSANYEIPPHAEIDNQHEHLYEQSVEPNEGNLSTPSSVPEEVPSETINPMIIELEQEAERQKEVRQHVKKQQEEEDINPLASGVESVHTASIERAAHNHTSNDERTQSLFHQVETETVLQENEPTIMEASIEKPHLTKQEQQQVEAIIPKHASTWEGTSEPEISPEPTVPPIRSPKPKQPNTQNETPKKEVPKKETPPHPPTHPVDKGSS